MTKATPPYLEVPGIRGTEPPPIPPLEEIVALAEGEHVVKAYHIRVQRPKFPWPVFFVIGLVTWGVGAIFVIIGHFLRARGHTFLYLTDQRVLVVELSRSPFERRQTVLNFAVKDISGFTVHAQHGWKKFLGLIRYKEKRTFYIEIVTRTTASAALGAVNVLGSDYDPGRDAVALCAELDREVMPLREAALARAA